MGEEVNAIIFLCGGNETGKTTTLKNLFQDGERSKRDHLSFFYKNLDKTRIYVVGTDSPQENKKSKFSDVGEVEDNIKRRIEICNAEAKDQSYILIVPISINQNEERKELNRRCVIEPIKSFRKDFIAFSFCLKKAKAKDKVDKDLLLREVADLAKPSREVETSKEEKTCPKGWDKSRELLAFIEGEVIPSMQKGESNQA
jgi:hypothetical protein